MAIVVLAAVSIAGGGWALARPAAALPPVLAAQLAFAAAAGLTLSLKPLPALRAGPLAELADDRTAVFAWLCGRTTAGLAAMAAPVAVSAALMGWRPDPYAPLIVAAASAGIGLGAAFRLHSSAPVRLLANRRRRSRAVRPAASRAGRLRRIELSRRERGLPVGLTAAAAWIGALLVAMVEVDPRLRGVADAASALLVFVAALQTLGFDPATVRLLGFEPNSLAGLARDLFGGRLVAAMAAGVLIALVGASVALVGLALGVGFRALEFLHVVRRHADARLLAQLEIGLALVIAVIAGPAAIVWIMARLAWLYRRARLSMGLA